MIETTRFRFIFMDLEVVSAEKVGVADAGYAIEIGWKATANNGGYLNLYIDDNGLGYGTSLINLDNDTKQIDRVALGAVSGVDATTTGPITLVLSAPAAAPISAWNPTSREQDAR